MNALELKNCGTFTMRGPGIAGLFEGALTICAEGATDLIVDQEKRTPYTNIPFVYREVEGDFTFRTKVTVYHRNKFDAGTIIAFQDDTHWAKVCFEQSDEGFKDVCTVMTNGISDDCNGPIIEGDTVYLQLSRKGNIFAVHYSLDGSAWHMVRICYLPFTEKLDVGFSSQSPTGEDAAARFKEYTLMHTAPSDMRAGV